MRYSTAENWAKYFEEAEGIQICGDTIRNRLHRACIIGETGRDKIGRVLRNAFFSEADIRCTCADLLQPLLQADVTGFFVKDGQKYGTVGALSKTLEISSTAIKSRIKTHKPQSIKGKDMNGHVCDFFAESVIRNLCVDLLELNTMTDKTGFFIKDGKRYGTIKSWPKVIGISASTILAHIKTLNIQSIKGKDTRGVIRDFYSENDVCYACADLVSEIPQSDENGFFVKDGQRYGTIESISKTIGISVPALLLRVKTHKPQSVKGKDKSGHVRDFYSESDIREICADLLQPILQADETSFFVKDGKRYGTIGVWPKVLRISSTAIKSRIKTHKPKSIKGKDKSGHVRNFYSESDIREICTDLLQTLPEADDNGFFVKDGQRYSTIVSWSKTLGISEKTIVSRIKTHNIQSIKGKDKGGRIFAFFSESSIRKICADILAKRNPSTSLGTGKLNPKAA